jgi:class 3 adenylate cyclase
MSAEQISKAPAEVPAPKQATAEPVAPLREKHMRSRWLANKRQELLAPATAILDLCEMLVRDARDRGQESLLKDLEQVNAAALRFLSMVKELLDPVKPEPAGDEFNRHIRHDLRSPLTPMMGLCEMWLEDADELLLGGFVSDLQKIHSLCKQLLSSLDELVAFNQLANAAEADVDKLDHADMFRDLAGCLPALDEDGGPATEAGVILIVDDNEVNRDILARRLCRQGHTPVLAENGRQALDMVHARRFDLILLDIIMPQMNGFQVLQALKADADLRHIPVIMISALNEIDSVARCIEMGAEDYLTKPFNPVVLRARIDACLDKKRFRDREVQYLEQIQKERARADELLHVILPGQIVNELKATNDVLPRRHENVAVMFCDIVGFTPYCDASAPELVVSDLRKLIESWEEIAIRHQVEKIKTIGDAFMAVGGLLQKLPECPVLHCVRSGLEMIAATANLAPQWQLRVGIHVGPVVAGVIGRRQYLFDLWGDTVNTAARIESNGAPGRVTLSGVAWQQIAYCSRGESRGMVAVKGKGEMEMVRFDGFIQTGGE